MNCPYCHSSLQNEEEFPPIQYQLFCPDCSIFLHLNNKRELISSEKVFKFQEYTCHCIYRFSQQQLFIAIRPLLHKSISMPLPNPQDYPKYIQIILNNQALL